jgi:hypothetical protein
VSRSLDTIRYVDTLQVRLSLPTFRLAASGDCLLHVFGNDPFDEEISVESIKRACVGTIRQLNSTAHALLKSSLFYSVSEKKNHALRQNCILYHPSLQREDNPRASVKHDGGGEDDSSPVDRRDPVRIPTNHATPHEGAFARTVGSLFAAAVDAAVNFVAARRR